MTELDEAETVDERLAALGKRIESVAETQAAVRKSSIKPRLERLQERSQSAADEREALAERCAQLEETVAGLRAELEAVAGLADDQETTPDKRAADLAQILIRRARARDGAAAMYYKEVQDAFKDLGHGRIAKPDCYKAMEQVADRDGFAMDTKTSADSGQRVKAVSVELDALTAQTGSRNPTTSKSDGAGGSAASEVRKPFDS